MTKAKTKGQKLHLKKLAKLSLPDLAEVPKAKKRGRARMEELNAEPDAQMVVLTARARQSGISPKDIMETRDPAYGEAAGRAIYVTHKPEVAQRLWAVYRAFTASEAMYLRLCLGLRLHAATAKLEMMPGDDFQVRPDDKPDLRTEDEKASDASNAWARWRGYFTSMADYHQDAISDVSYGRVDAMDGGRLTDHGRRFVVAMERFADVVDRATGTR
ncbi:MAG: hypothetical protein COZ09_10070 [Comamonadaceae bacterium CG_4_10_14_3_um_filter_60_42]|nr:MAG: hypothetical protein COZ09_10070 [Comamonadaceae bacterium CG_4_10_14_3_um_filter_60_42]